MTTYTIRVRRVVEDSIEIKMDGPDVEEAIRSALVAAQEGFPSDVYVHAEVVGNIHDSEGNLWV